METNKIDTSSSKKSETSFVVRLGQEIFSVFFWLYFILNTFFINIDTWLSSSLGSNFSWLVTYKFVVLITVAAVIWVFSKKGRFALGVLHILFYPLVLLWKLASLLWRKKNWILTIAIANMTANLIRQFKVKFVLFTVMLISASLILSLKENSPLLWVGLIGAAAFFYITLFRRFVSVFQNAPLYEQYSKLVETMTSYTQKTYSLPDDLRGMAIVEMSERQIQSWVNNVQIVVIFSRVFQLLSSKLVEFRKSGATLVINILSFLALLLTSVFSFSLMNFALFKIDSANFRTEGAVSFFDFIFSSFMQTLLGGTEQIIAVSQLTRGILMLQTFTSFLLAAILLMLVFDYRRTRDEEALSTASEKIRNQEEVLNQFLSEEYSQPTPEAAVKELEKIGASLIKFIYFLYPKDE